MTISRQSQRSTLSRIAAPICILLALTVGALYLIKTQFAPTSNEEHADIQVNKTLPDLTLTQLGGSIVRLSSIPAKVSMVTFWATWCEACMVEMPSIVRLRNKYKDSGFEVLGINLDENPEAVAPQAAKKMNIAFPIFKDPDGKTAEFFDVRAIPLTIIIDHQRKILLIQDGEWDWNSPAVHKQLERWLAA